MWPHRSQIAGTRPQRLVLIAGGGGLAAKWIPLMWLYNFLPKGQVSLKAPNGGAVEAQP